MGDTTLREAILFCLVFTVQVLSISWLYARRVLSRERYVLQAFPPSTHPKLYPQPTEYYERRLRAFARLNGALVIAGGAIVLGLLAALVGDWGAALVSPSGRQRWDTFIVVPFFLLQAFASVSLEVSKLDHHRALAKAPPPRVRTTELRRRQLFDFVSPALLVAAVLTNLGFVAFVLYYQRFGFAWFTAAGNIAAVAGMVVLFSTLVALALRAPKPDPYQTYRDRHHAIRLLVRQALAACIALPVLVTANLMLKLVEPDLLEPVVASVFCQAAALALLWPSYRQGVDTVDFDVYRADPSSAS